MDFETIALTRKELRILARSEREPIPIMGNEKLIRHGLVEERTAHTPGLMPVGTGFADITDIGRDYLAYVSNRNRDSRATRRHDWMIAVFSTLGGALLSKPIWETLELLAQWIIDLT